jgi:hypothetical protein
VEKRSLKKVKCSRGQKNVLWTEYEEALRCIDE